MSIPAICCRRRHSQPQSDGVNMYRHINVQRGQEGQVCIRVHKEETNEDVPPTADFADPELIVRLQGQTWLPQYITTVAGDYDILFGMRRCRINLPNRCYHLISRVAHRAYFLDEGERTRLVDFVRRVAEFSGVKLLVC